MFAKLNTALFMHYMQGHTMNRTCKMQKNITKETPMAFKESCLLLMFDNELTLIKRSHIIYIRNYLFII